MSKRSRKSTGGSFIAPRQAGIIPIRNDRDLHFVEEEIDEIIDSKPGTPEHDRLEILSDLVELYESQHYPVGPPSPIEAIKFRLEQQEDAAKILEPILGSRSRVHEILKGKRPLTLRMIRNLHQKLGIPLESLIADTR